MCGISPFVCLSISSSPPLKHLHQCQFGFALGAGHLNAGIDGIEVDVVLLDLRFLGFEFLGQFI